MDEVAVAWCAGFLDGEGSFMLAKRPFGNRRPCIGADQIDREPLAKLHAVIGGRLLDHPARQTSAGNDVWRWYMRSAEQIIVIVPRLLPHLTVKRERAELILAHALLSPGIGRQISAPDRAARQSIEARLVGLDQGGQ